MPSVPLAAGCASQPVARQYRGGIGEGNNGLTASGVGHDVLAIGPWHDNVGAAGDLVACALDCERIKRRAVLTLCGCTGSKSTPRVRHTNTLVVMESSSPLLESCWDVPHTAGPHVVPLFCGIPYEHERILPAAQAVALALSALQLVHDLPVNAERWRTMPQLGAVRGVSRRPFETDHQLTAAATMCTLP